MSVQERRERQRSQYVYLDICQGIGPIVLSDHNGFLKGQLIVALLGIPVGLLFLFFLS